MLIVDVNKTVGEEAIVGMDVDIDGLVNGEMGIFNDMLLSNLHVYLSQTLITMFEGKTMPSDMVSIQSFSFFLFFLIYASQTSGHCHKMLTKICIMVSVHVNLN